MRRLRTSAAGALATLAIVTGCTTGPQFTSTPTVVATPEIEWENGAPDGELESNEFVVAARAASLGIVLAQNSHDYTIAQLTDYVSPELVVALYENDLHYLDVTDGRARADPGPPPLLAMSVTETGTGADVEFCSPSGDWSISSVHPESEVDPTTGVTVTYAMSREDDRLILTEVGGVSSECDSTGTAIGRFSPKVELPDSVTEDSVRPPIGYEG